MFAKLLSINDELMWRYFTLLSFLPEAEIAKLRAEVAAGRNPKEAKVRLAREITARFHDEAAADAAEEDFRRRAQGGVPDEIPEVVLRGAPVSVGTLLKACGLVPSTSEGLRMVEQGGVRIDGAVVSDKGLKVAAGTCVVQVGKRRFARVTLER
jgi:tyrosyl-tRNA synthetase